MHDFNVRPTTYRRLPLQTQSNGTQNLSFDIGTLFSQSVRIILAEALGVLGSDSPPISDSFIANLEAMGLSDEEISRVVKRGKALPQFPQLDFANLSVVAQMLADIANDNGKWRQHFESHAEAIVDQKVKELKPRLAASIGELLSQFGLRSVIRSLSSVAQRWKHDVEDTHSDPWKPQYAEQLRRGSEYYQRLAAEVDQRPWWRRWRPALTSADREQIKLQFERDVQLANCRMQSMKLEISRRIKRLLLNPRQTDSLAGKLAELATSYDRMRHLRSVLTESLHPLSDTATISNVVHSALEPLGGDNGTVHDLIVGVLEAQYCGPRHVADRIRKGLPYRGSVLTLLDLLALNDRQSLKVLDSFVPDFFGKAIDSILEIDLTEEKLQLPLARALLTATRKAEPYLKFPHLQGETYIRETYLHCHPDVRPVILKLKPSNVRFAHPGLGGSFDIPQRHVISITTNILAPGHARKEYALARYVRDQMIGMGEFSSIYPFNQALAQPLVIAERPTEERDSLQLFEIALQFGRVRTVSRDSQTPEFTLASMDETVRFCFERRIVSRVLRDADHFVGLLDETWFADFVSASISGLPPDWHEDLLKQMDQASALTIAKQMVTIGILVEDKPTERFRFALPYQPSMTPHPAIFRIEQRMRVGLQREEFIRKLITVDELYTRLVEDLITAEAMKQVPYRRLTPFIKHLIDQRRMGGSQL